MSDLKVGLQLYSIRGDMEEDMEGTLEKVKSMGYDYVEFAGYYGRTAEEVLELLDKYDLECVSVHSPHELFLEDGQNSIDFLKKIGAKYSAVPWMDIDKHAGGEKFEQTKEEFTKVGKILKDAGITLLYHNHEFEFKTYEDKYLLDWLYESVPEDLLQTEIDTCWVNYAGVDPVEYLKKYSGRSPVVHLKDFVCKNKNSGSVYALIDSEGKTGEEPSREDNEFEFRPLGEGIQDIPAILEAAKEVGTLYVIVEQDESTTCTPLEAAKKSRDYLKTLGL